MKFKNFSIEVTLSFETLQPFNTDPSELRKHIKTQMEKSCPQGGKIKNILVSEKGVVEKDVQELVKNMTENLENLKNARAAGKAEEIMREYSKPKEHNDKTPTNQGMGEKV